MPGARVPYKTSSRRRVKDASRSALTVGEIGRVAARKKACERKLKRARTVRGPTRRSGTTRSKCLKLNLKKKIQKQNKPVYRDRLSPYDNMDHGGGGDGIAKTSGSPPRSAYTYVVKTVIIRCVTFWTRLGKPYNRRFRLVRRGLTLS